MNGKIEWVLLSTWYIAVAGLAVLNTMGHAWTGPYLAGVALAYAGAGLRDIGKLRDFMWSRRFNR